MEYKSVKLGDRLQVKGGKNAEDKAISQYTEIIRSEATYGWKYLSTEIVPVQIKKGVLFKKLIQKDIRVLLFYKE